MKLKTFIPFVLLLLLVTACEPEAQTSADPYLVSSEVFTSRVGENRVYGVQMRLSSEERSFRQYAVELKVNSKVWLDTINLEIPAGDTLETELIFSGAIVSENDLVQHSLKGRNIE